LSRSRAGAASALASSSSSTGGSQKVQGLLASTRRSKTACAAGREMLRKLLCVGRRASSGLRRVRSIRVSRQRAREVETDGAGAVISVGPSVERRGEMPGDLARIAAAARRAKRVPRGGGLGRWPQGGPGAAPRGARDPLLARGDADGVGRRLAVE